MRTRVAQKTHGFCWYCGEMKFGDRGPTMDHQVPRSRRGTDNIRNLVCACYDCNNEKDDRTVEEYRTLIQANLIGFYLALGLPRFNVPRVQFFGEMLQDAPAALCRAPLTEQAYQRELAALAGSPDDTEVEGRRKRRRRRTLHRRYCKGFYGPPVPAEFMGRVRALFKARFGVQR